MSIVHLFWLLIDKEKGGNDRPDALNLLNYITGEEAKNLVPRAARKRER